MKTLPAIAILFAVASAALFAGEPPAKEPEKSAVTDENVFNLAATMKRATQSPYQAPKQTMILCGYSGQTQVSAGTLTLEQPVKPSAPAAKPSAQPPSPRFKDFSHAPMGMHVYLNTIAEDALGKKATAYPTGAMIVKEKLDGKGDVVGVGGMIKRAPGYDADNGDWEYFYADKGAKLAQGRLDNCANCHSETRATDFVFAHWRAK